MLANPTTPTRRLIAVPMPLVDIPSIWPPKGGAMAEMIRHADWSQTPLGPCDQWPSSLRIAVAAALDSPLPTIVLWGSNLLQIYNDAYQPILGLRHPAAMGQPTHDCWPEVFQFNQPIYHRVMGNGQTVHLEDQEYVIEPSGVPETRYFTVTYTPLRDESGAARGVTVIAVETTQRVLMERENQALHQASRFADDQLQQMFAQAPNFMIVLKGPDHVFEMVNAFGRNLFFGRDLIGMTVLQSFPEVAAQGFVKILDEVYQSGKPYLATDRLVSFSVPSGLPDASTDGSTGERKLERYVDFVYQPIKNKKGQISGIFISGNDVTQNHLARLALDDNLRHLRESDARHSFQLKLSDCLRPLASAQEVTTAACELLGVHLGVSRVVFCEINDALGTFFVRSEWSRDRQGDMAGMTRALNDFGPDHVAQLRTGQVSANHDVTLDSRTADHAQAFIERGIRADLAVPLVKSGALTVILALHHPTPHQWTAAEIDLVKDTAERTWSAAESVRAQSELRAERDQSQHLFNIMTEGFSVIDNDWRIAQINGEGLRIGRRTKQQVLGHKLWDIWPEVIDTELDRVYRRVMATREQETFQQQIHFADDHKLSLAITVYPMLDTGIAAFVRDITEREEAIEALRISHSRAENALTVAKLGTFDFNVVTRQIECSARSCEIFGLPVAQDHSADEFSQRIVASDLPRFRQEIADARAQNRRLDLEYRIQLPDGSIRHIVSASTCQTDSDGVVVRQVGVVSDVTAQKQAEDKLRDVDRRKDEFLAMLAHELRNPLAPITMAAGILGRPGVNQKTLQEMSAMVVRQASHMTSLIDDLLDVSRINNGLVTLEREAVDLKDIVASAVEQVRSLMEKHNHDFSMQVAAEALRVKGDRVRLVQVFANILINAAKYTPEGGKIFLDLGVSRSLSGSQATVLVRDNGVGMSERLLPHIFDIFTQGERTPDRSQGGLGLGLSLVKNLVNLLGGTVSARSEGAGKGSEFTVVLPLLDAEPPPDDTQVTPSSAGVTAVQIKHIMVVDDNVDAATTVAMLLEMDGHTVSVAHSAEQALAITSSAAHYPPQAFLLDIGLPGMDGYELARQLRALTATANATLIALTGYGQPRDRERSKVAGFNHHLEKPVDPDRLLALLNGPY